MSESCPAGPLRRGAAGESQDLGLIGDSNFQRGCDFWIARTLRPAFPKG